MDRFSDSDLDSSTLSRTTSIALALSNAYPDIIGLFRDFERSLEEEQRHLVVHDLGEKVGRLLARHHFEAARSMPSLSWGIRHVVLEAVRPFAIAQADDMALRVIACPFCREVKSEVVHCGFLAGLFVGLLNASGGSRIEVKETACRARGDACCRFEFSASEALT